MGIIRMTKKKLEDKNYVVMVCRAYFNDMGKSMEDLGKELNISAEGIKKCIYVAGVKNWISFQLLEGIKEKEHRQQAKHFNTKVYQTSSDERFDKIIFPERRKYIRDNLTKEFTMKVVRTYLEYASRWNAYEFVGLSKIEMNDILVKGAILGYIPNSEFKTMMEIAVLKDGNMNQLLQIQAARDDYQFFPAEIEERENLLSSYDEVFSDADEAPSKEELQSEIDQRKARLKEIEYYIDHWNDKE